MKRKICLLLVVFILLTTITTYGQVLDQEKLNTDLEFMKNVINFVIGKYNYEVDQDDIINGLYDGFFGVLDEYSVYYTAEEYKSLLTDTAGEFVGIGVQITDLNGQIVVLTPLPNSPAIEAGIKNGDIIKYVDNKDISGLTSSEAAALIKGKEGTYVKIGIIRDNKEINFDIIRRTVITSSVEGKILENGIGYLKITSFSENIPSLVMKELSIFDKNKVEKIIIDLRNNGGGTLNSAVELLNLFVTKGPVLYVDYANGQEEVYSSELEEQKYDLALLINGGSASATEIFAGAVKYKNEGIIIGTKSFGKGIVQSLYQLKNGSGVKFTTAEYFSVDKKPVHKVGITPDIIIENPVIDLSKYPT
ncbi:MAG: S41 family peptidase, partial [Tissierellia bacterium]|nr:S41 family peptidase [Tissierellia bacterium]